MCFCLAVLCAVMAGCGTAQPAATQVTTTPPAPATTAPTETTGTDEPVHKIVFSQKFLNVADMTAEEWAVDLENTSEGQFTDIYVNADGVSVTLEVTETQRKFWLEDRKEYIDELLRRFEAFFPEYRMEINDDYTNVDFYYDLNMSVHNVAYYMLYAENFCVTMQLLNGVGAEDWYMSINVYNSDTGKLVASGDSEIGFGYEPEDWERSYISEIVFSEKFLRVAQMEPQAWVDDLIATSEDQYVDVYVNEDGKTVTLEITEEQREYWKASRAEYIAVLQEKFTEIDPNYRIEISDDYTQIDLYYNLDLDAYSVTYNVVYSEVFSICMQLFNGVGAEEWFVAFNIYNSDTGKLVTSGDSNVGMSYEAEDWEASE